MAIQIERTTDTNQAVTTAEMKVYLKTNYGADTDEDALLVDLIFAATRFLEDRFNFSITSKAWTAWTDRKKDLTCKFKLPRGPHLTITSVKRVDDEGTKTTLTLNTDYYKKGLTDLVLYFQGSPSDGVPRGANINLYPIEVVFTAGFATVPDDLKAAVMQLVAENYVNRENTTDVSITIVPETSSRKASVYARTRIL
jgi:uncharacterized phiE125 gp8 family phage protein